MVKQRNIIEGDIHDVGFCEADIISSIEAAAQGHIKWIYDCLMARMSQSDRQVILEKSILIYKGYVKKTILKQMKQKQ